MEINEKMDIYEHDIKGNILFYLDYENTNTVKRILDLAKKYNVSTSIKFVIENPNLEFPVVVVAGNVSNLKEDIPRDFLLEIVKIRKSKTLIGYIEDIYTDIGFELDENLRIKEVWIPEE